MVGIVMGSKSDLKVMEAAAEILKTLEVPFELTVVSAHRTPDRLSAYAKSASERGIRVIIAGAGGAAHLPGMLAANTLVPIIGVPVKSSNSIDGWDSVLSILQMPKGVPVATVALDGAFNAGLLAAQMLALNDMELVKRLASFRDNQSARVNADIQDFKADYNNQFD